MDRNDNIAFLKEARAALAQLNEVKESRDRLELESKTLEKNLRDEKKAVNDAVKTTVRRRQEELAASYDNELSRMNEKIKKEKQRREKAVAHGKKERMKSETEQLRAQIKQLKAECRELFRKEKLPGFCNTGLYYALFCTKTMKELGTLILAVLLCFLALPLSLYFLLPYEGLLALFVIYVLDALVFGGGYLLISEKTRMLHAAAIRSGRAYREAMEENRRKIRRIENSILHDNNESYYELEEYDSNLSELQSQLQTLADQKEEALENFENVTRKVIVNEIRDNSRIKIETLESDLEQARKNFKEFDTDSRELGLAFSENYGIYVEKSFWQPEKLDQLIAILQKGEAESITEAQNLYKMKYSS